jgi:hypothetical protein
MSTVRKKALGDAIRKAREYVREKERDVIVEATNFFYSERIGEDRLRNAVHYLLEAENVVDRLTGRDEEA